MTNTELTLPEGLCTPHKADLLKINVFKFRKGSSSRETYRAAATKSWAKRKEK